jgi:prepilin-type N-terminal cleavage/methylation domain-containing protein
MIVQQQEGSTLLELLIALAIFAVGILSLSYLQFLSFRNMNQALYRAIAIQQMANLLTHCQIFNDSDVLNTSYSEWQQNLLPLLPEASSTFLVSKAWCQIHLTWHPPVVFFNADGTPVKPIDELQYGA